MIVTLTGSNDFLRQAELDKLVLDFIAKNSDIGLEKLDGEEADFQKIYDALTSLPFLASKKMVVLKGPSANKEFVEKAEDLLKNLPGSTDLILVEQKFDKRSSLYKFLKKTTDFHEFNDMDPNGLAKWLAGRAAEQKGSLGSADARFLIDRIGTSQQMLASELDKLLLYSPKVTKENIELLTEQAPQSTVFELLDAAFAGNTDKALKIYSEQRALKVEPQQIVAMLAWQLNVLSFIKTAGERSPDEVAREAKLNPFVVRKSISVARRLNLSELKKLIQNLLELDVKLKTESIDADEALQLYILNLGNI